MCTNTVSIATAELVLENRKKGVPHKPCLAMLKTNTNFFFQMKLCNRKEKIMYIPAFELEKTYMQILFSLTFFTHDLIQGLFLIARIVFIF